MNSELQLCELRHNLLLALGQLHQPTYALERLDEFKADIIRLGIPATVYKWADYVEELKGVSHDDTI